MSQRTKSKLHSGWR